MPIEQLAGVICAGGICLDILLRPIDQLQWGTSTWAEEFIEELGGNGGNTAFAAALLGAPVRLMGMVGEDAAGDRVLERLRGAGVDLSLVERAAAQTTTTICIVNSAGDRFFLKNLGVSKQTFVTPIEFTAPVAAGHTHFHLANLFSLPHLSRHGGEILRRARVAGLSTSLDTGWDPENRWLERVGPCLPQTDLLFINQDEARMLTGSDDPQTAARFLREQGVRDVAMKLGAEGCVVATPETSFHSPGFQVETVDTTGAGDCFAGAFLAALHRGESYERAACFANAVGAMAVRQLGAISGMRPYAETMAWFELEQAKRQAAG